MPTFLEELRAEKDQAAQRIQTVWRGKKARKSVSSRQDAASFLQTIARGFLARQTARWHREYAKKVAGISEYSSRHEQRLAQLKEEKRRLLGLGARQATQHVDKRADDAAIKIQAALRRKKRLTLKAAKDAAIKDQDAASLRIQRMYKARRLRRAKVQRSGPPPRAKDTGRSSVMAPDLDDLRIEILHQRIEAGKERFRPSRPVTLSALRLESDKAHQKLSEHKQRWLDKQDASDKLTFYMNECATLSSELDAVNCLDDLLLQPPKPRGRIDEESYELHRQMMDAASKKKWWLNLEVDDVDYPESIWKS